MTSAENIWTAAAHKTQAIRRGTRFVGTFLLVDPRNGNQHYHVTDENYSTRDEAIREAHTKSDRLLTEYNDED